jgi:D-alanyl-D-alanine carboxypeptidase (penicillin-binding protein 5/6)
LFKAGESVAQARIWKAANEFTRLGLESDLYITVPRGTYEDLESILNVPAILTAPVAQGQAVAELRVSLNGSSLITEPLRALDDNPSGSIWQRARDSVQLWFE